ncbi:MAG: hypothetical protein AMXMBFR64_17610 [Myxococcales bacterium]
MTEPLCVALVGVFPPPLGGVSVHLQRLAARLEDQGVSVMRQGAPTGPPFFGYHLEVLRRTRGAHVVHAHLHGAAHLALLAALARTCRRVVLTIHGDNVVGPALEGHRSRAAVTGAALRSLHAVVCVNPRIQQEVLALGVRHERTLVAPAFLPPDERTLSTDVLPEVAAFVDRHRPVLSASAFTFDLHRGILLYGQDQLVELVARLAPSLPDLGLVVHLSRTDGPSAERFAATRALARERGVDDRVLWVPGSRDLGPTLARSDALIRPTATDGDAVSVREALHLGVPVVASDAVGRPEGTHVARSGDLDALVAATRKALASERRRQPQPDPFPRLLALYREVAG